MIFAKVPFSGYLKLSSELSCVSIRMISGQISGSFSGTATVWRRLFLMNSDRWELRNSSSLKELRMQTDKHLALPFNASWWFGVGMSQKLDGTEAIGPFLGGVGKNKCELMAKSHGASSSATVHMCLRRRFRLKRSPRLNVNNFLFNLP